MDCSLDHISRVSRCSAFSMLLNSLTDGSSLNLKSRIQFGCWSHTNDTNLFPCPAVRAMAWHSSSQTHGWDLWSACLSSQTTVEEISVFVPVLLMKHKTPLKLFSVRKSISLFKYEATVRQS